MSKEFSCQTCGYLCTDEFDRDGEAVIIYVCQCGIGFVNSNPDIFFCAAHTDTETVKRIREGV